MDPNQHKENRLKLQVQALRSGNRSAILGALRELRRDGNVSILPDLFELLLEQEDEQVRGEIVSVLNDLKKKEAAPILAEAIANPAYAGIQNLLVSACWQNGLAYGKYINIFVEVAISGTYDTAIEAFTVIEETAGDLEQEQREQLIHVIKSRMQEVEEQKKPLLSELIKVIANY